MTDLTAKVLNRLAKGDHLHMQLTNSGRVWWFESPRLQVPDAIAAAIVTAPDTAVGEAGDSLFGLPLNSQTWLSNA